jgi:hypothetical protein
MTLFGIFLPILRGFDVIKVVCVRYNLNRPNYCEIATMVSVTISHDLTALPSSMNRQPNSVRYIYKSAHRLFITAYRSVSVHQQNE